MVSKQTPKIRKNIFCQFWNILKIRKIRNNQEGQARRAQVGCAHLGYLPDSVFSVCLFPKIKNLYIPPEPIDHRIAEKSSVLFSCCFRSDLSSQASCLPHPLTTEKKTHGWFKRT